MSRAARRRGRRGTGGPRERLPLWMIVVIVVMILAFMVRRVSAAVPLAA
jgi:hypothetical protein